ncbi:carbon-nitrogen hydrolase family protein [Vibrio quintilis]|uniref:(R)-stereoselective amidase n=1 Tax=Vibrio quintilis TaxID=1117707 RepID=A0A1M7YUR4_9VIBR|nr:carbon-nitrogen hydrolase family protein [Vibrio quintilis]SHO56335.1 (R)-stereoselective amidase [Vibrio quintilis]
MQNFKIAVAQIPSVKGDIFQNIENHLNAIDIAARYKTSIIIFPELSLTGYEPQLASSLALTASDERLNPLAKSACENAIWIVAGAPLLSESGLHIGSLIFGPNGSISTYSKMNLHPGEDQYFVRGDEPKILKIQDQKVAIAICADANNPLHAKSYAENSATVYAAGVFVTDGGYNSDTQKMQEYAEEHDLLVVMANHNKPTGGWEPVGKSATWSKDGLLGVASKEKDSIILSHQANQTWKSQVIEM